jgi:hypothetical protein
MWTEAGMAMRQELSCDALAEIISRFGGRSRFKLRGEVEVEPWGSWLIAPVSGYLEIGGCGPYSISELEWVETEPGSAGPEALLAALTEAGLSASVVQHAVRVQMGT